MGKKNNNEIKNEVVNKDEQLKELKKAADKSFKKKYSNKRKIATAAICLLGLATVGAATPVIVSNINQDVDITVKSSNAAMQKYKVEVKKGTKISEIKVVELEGYDFVGFFKDEACTKAYQPTDTLKTDVAIYASYSQKQYNINITGDVDNYNLNTNRTVNYGESYTLTISPKTGFFLEGLTVKVNNQVVTLTNGTYTIEDITADVSVELIESTHTVSIIGDVENYEISNNATIVYGQPYTLNISPKSGYFVEGVIVKVNNQEVVLTNGSYTIPSVTTNTTIELIEKTYTVSVVGDVENYEVSGNATLVYGQPYTLSISEKSGYFVEGVIVKVNNQEVVLTNGSYTIPNVTTNTTIELIEKTYTVSVVGDKEHYNVSSNTTLVYGQPYTLSISAKSGYFIEGVTVKVNNQEVTLNNGSYTISSVTENTTIELIEKTCTVSVVGDKEHYNVSSNATLVYGKPYVLNITAKEGFDVSFLTVKVNNQEVTLTNGSYRIANVTEDTTIELIANNETTFVNIGNSSKLVGFMPNSTIKNIVELIDDLEYETSGTVYLDEECTQEADLDAPMTATTTLYTKAATLDKLSFTWDSSTTSWSVKAKNTSITEEVIIPASYTNGTKNGSVTSIVGYAFYDCRGLTSLTIPNSVTSIGDDAFWGCSGLTEITIPNSVTTIGGYAFSRCSSLTSAVIGNSVITIRDDIFSNCSSLTSITVEEGNNVYHSSGNCLIETASKTLIAGCKTSIIPTDGSVTIIGEKAFEDCSGLTSITIPNGVTYIGSYAFQGCNSLAEITIPNSVTSIRAGAFWLCTSLTEIIIPKSVTILGSYSTLPSSLTSIVVEEGNRVYHSSGNCLIRTASKTLIRGCNTSVIPTDGSVTSIGDSAFEDCSGLTSITIPNGVTYIGSSAFSGCSGITSITIPNSVTTIGNYAFSGCSLTTIEIPKSVTTIEEGTAFDTGLTSITVEEGNTVYHSSGNCLIETASKTLIRGCKTSVIPTDGSVTIIGEAAFFGCSGLTEITIPNSVTTISNGAFGFCVGLKSITIPSSVVTIGYAFDNTAIEEIIIDSQSMITKDKELFNAFGILWIESVTTIYVNIELDTSNSTYLTSNFTKQATSDKDGYDKWVKNS